MYFPCCVILGVLSGTRITRWASRLQTATLNNYSARTGEKSREMPQSRQPVWKDVLLAFRCERKAVFMTWQVSESLECIARTGANCFAVSSFGFEKGIKQFTFTASLALFQVSFNVRSRFESYSYLTVNPELSFVVIQYSIDNFSSLNNNSIHFSEFARKSKVTVYTSANLISPNSSQISCHFDQLIIVLNSEILDMYM